MYELPHELTNGVILKILGNEEILRKLKIGNGTTKLNKIIFETFQKCPTLFHSVNW